MLSSFLEIIAGVLVVIKRPKTAPISLLALYTLLLVSHFLISALDPFVLRYDGIATVLGMSGTLIAIIIILCMPLRDPDMPNDKISPAFKVPDHLLRSPEDNLTLWQFMTVSWMSPLISLGATRQLNDQDIWALSYEFQHRRLHEKFRELPGSVLRRVISANRIDVVIVMLLDIVELCAGMVPWPRTS